MLRAPFPSRAFPALQIALLLTALAPGFVTAQPRQHGQALDSHRAPNVIDLQLWVTDVRSGKKLTTIREGDVLELQLGQQVEVRAAAIGDDLKRTPSFPKMRYDILSGARRVSLAFPKGHPESVRITAERVDDPAKPGSTTLIDFATAAPLNASPRIQAGTFTIKVTDPNAPPVPAPAATRGTQIVHLLYRAALLREPRPEEIPLRAARIDGEGFGGVITVARDIAGSIESREEVFRRTVTVKVGDLEETRRITSEDRLRAIYREVLGQEALDNLPEKVWKHDLDRVRNGLLPFVLTDLLYDQAFLSRFGYNPTHPYQAVPR